MTFIAISLSRSLNFLKMLRQYFGEISDGQTNEITFAFGELIGRYKNIHIFDKKNRNYHNSKYSVTIHRHNNAN